MSKDKPYTSKTRAPTGTIVASSPFTEMPSPVRYVPQLVASKLSAPSTINRSSFPLSFFPFSLHFLLSFIPTATSPKLARAASDPPPQATLAHFLTFLHTVALHTAATKQTPSPHTDYKNERTITSSILSLLST
jgi:hypothetical protein